MILKFCLQKMAINKREAGEEEMGRGGKAEEEKVGVVYLVIVRKRVQ